VTNEKQRNHLNAILYLNLAYCYLKLKSYVACISFCHDVLKLSEDKDIREKCFYRRGEANRHLMHIDRALQDFRAVLDITETNESALESINRCNKLPQVCRNHFLSRQLYPLVKKLYHMHITLSENSVVVNENFPVLCQSLNNIQEHIDRIL
jgi:hypothetical protein